jgi:AcrR family transcriptional regulator
MHNGGDARCPAGSGRSNRPDRKRQAIMQAAERLFTSRRIHEITMDDVAAAAGVAKGTLYNHFRDKDDLFFQTCIAGFEELCELLEQKVNHEVSFQQQLLEASRGISGFFDRRRQLFRMMQAEDARMPYCGGALRDRWAVKRTNLVSAIARILAGGVASGMIRDDLPPEVLANILLGMLRARSRGLADVPASMRSHEIIVDLFCNGAGCGPGARSAAPRPQARSRAAPGKPQE